MHSDQTVLLTKAFAPESQLTSFSKKKSSRSRGEIFVRSGDQSHCQSSYGHSSLLSSVVNKVNVSLQLLYT